LQWGVSTPVVPFHVMSALPRQRENRRYTFTFSRGRKKRASGCIAIFAQA
jgi:hypothetical protein